jgi:hypothetical protein
LWPEQFLYGDWRTIFDLNQTSAVQERISSPRGSTEPSIHYRGDDGDQSTVGQGILINEQGRVEIE